jgi:hypothetical protein
MPDKKITRVRIEHGDGTFLELTDPAECERWQDTTASQAVISWNHGMTLVPFKWVEGMVGLSDPERIAKWLDGLETALTRMISLASMEERTFLIPRRGIYKGIADDIRNGNWRRAV